jgi:glutathione S-transferase
MRRRFFAFSRVDVRIPHFEQQQVDNVISRARFRLLYSDVVPTRPEEFEPCWRQGTRALRILEEHLRTRTYLVGEQFAIADLTLYAYVHCAEEGGFDLKPHSAVQTWLARVAARPRHLKIDDLPA